MGTVLARGPIWRHAAGAKKSEPHSHGRRRRNTY